MKRCWACKQTKELTEFHRNKTRKDGCQDRCKACDVVWMRERHRKARLNIVSFLGGSCSCCGETEPSFLDVDHIYGNGHEDRKKYRLHSSIELYKRVIAEPNTFQLLCGSCHNGKTRLGKCPHQSRVSEIL